MGAQKWKFSGQDLARHLLNPRRLHTVVITQSLRKDCPSFNADEIADEVQDWAEVIEVHSGRVTYELRDHLPKGWDVFGTAARVYPIGMTNDGFAPSKPHIVRPGEHIGHLTDEVIDEVLFLPNPRTLVVPTAPIPGPGRRAADPVRTIAPPGMVPNASGAHTALLSGIVTEFTNGGFTAKIALDTGGSVELKSEDIYADAPLSWIFGSNSRLTGVYDPQTQRFSLHDSLTHPRLLQQYSWNQLILCLVLETGADTAVLTPIPGERITVAREDVSSNELDDVDSLLAPGQVVVARLVNENGLRKLLLVDVDDDEPISPAPALIRGGTPWLALDRDLVPDLTDPERTATAYGLTRIPTPDKQREALRQALLNIDSLKSQLDTLRRQETNNNIDELATALEQATRYRDEAHKLRILLKNKSEALNESHKVARKKARLQNSTSASEIREKFSTPELSLRHELYMEWVERIPSNEKAAYPWNEGAVIFGPKFVDSFYAHGPVLRAKALKALIQLLTGQAERMKARDIHPKRIGAGGDNPQLVREDDGATCWRMSVESGVAAARRVHYWKHMDGNLELHELVAHDTFDL
ncbi:hypothetical protein CQ018_13095 [Arthrobacter sp. MYb227]|uniref:hypothetical protein n=1 Tax=Arthrobacter sp. MYb227 TaxID=1848601 RepID=UPI000CFCD017|nr:hypothetical protein [Arthrobacter sp. MYb227]PQZ91575.1 hypothetical protein CQ018_13095 [Arthrobacter sp. MYb227]